MRICLEGTEDEIADAVTALGAGFTVQQVSDFYPYRGSLVLGRVYVTAVVSTAGTVRASTQRTDRAPRGALEN